MYSIYAKIDKIHSRCLAANKMHFLSGEFEKSEKTANQNQDVISIDEFGQASRMMQAMLTVTDPLKVQVFWSSHNLAFACLLDRFAFVIARVFQKKFLTFCKLSITLSFT
jgi:hypothetical protein